jgi:hypothetical protein
MAQLKILETTYEKFDQIVDVLLNKSILNVNGFEFSLCEIELYYYGDGHYDKYTHRSSEQKQKCKFYFHKFSNGTYKSGTFKGMDITLSPNDETYFGVLIRSIRNRITGEFIEGPCNVVNKILSVCNVKSITELLSDSVLPLDIYESKLLYVSHIDDMNNDIYFGTRIGLSDKYPKYKNKKYRYVSNYEQIKKQKNKLELFVVDSQNNVDKSIKEHNKSKAKKTIKKIATSEKSEMKYNKNNDIEFGLSLEHQMDIIDGEIEKIKPIIEQNIGQYLELKTINRLLKYRHYPYIKNIIRDQLVNHIRYNSHIDDTYIDFQHEKIVLSLTKSENDLLYLSVRTIKDEILLENDCGSSNVLSLISIVAVRKKSDYLEWFHHSHQFSSHFNDKEIKKIITNDINRKYLDDVQSDQDVFTIEHKINSIEFCTKFVNMFFNDIVEYIEDFYQS